MLTELIVIFLLAVVNGVFAMAEIALVSSRKARLQQRASEGNVGARVALDLAESPNRFLSTVQIGITLIGVFAGAFGGATLARSLAPLLERIAFLRPYAQGAALVLVVLLTTYLSLVIGELVPKRLAMANPERIAAVISRPMRALSVIGQPIVKLLSFSTDLVLRLLGHKASEEPPVTEEELRVLLEEGTEAGVFEEVEQDMVESVLHLSDRRASSLMTPRPEIIWLDLEDPPEEIHRKILESGYSRFPAAQGSLDTIVGEVQARDLLAALLSGKPLDLSSVLRKPLYVPEVMPAFAVLEHFRQSGTEMALVINEYGSVSGLVTMQDILEAIVGDIPSADEASEPEIVQREDGSWLLDGMLTIEEVKDLFDVEDLPGEEQGLYQTLSGFVMANLGRIPNVADYFEWGGLRFEVMDMDGNRLDRLLVQRIDDQTDAVGSDGERPPE